MKIRKRIKPEINHVYRSMALSSIILSLAFFIISPVFADTWALLVGIDDYENPDISDLRFTVDDVARFREVLVDPAACSVPSENVYLMTNASSGRDLPKHNNILFRLENLAKRIKPEDTFIFYFSGHGMAQDGEQYLLSINSDPGTFNTLAVTAVPLQRVQKLLGEIRAHQILVILDACRNDPEKGKGDVNNVMTDELARSVRVKPRKGVTGQVGCTATLYAASLGQRAYEWEAKSSGVFSYYLTQGLGGMAADAKNQVTLRGLAEYVIDEVGKWSTENEKDQIPWLVSEGAADMVLARFSGKPIKNIPSLHTQVRQVRSRPQAVAWSILPGGGQFYNRRIGKGLAWGGLEVVGIAAAVGFHLNYSNKQDKYMSTSKITDMKAFGSDANRSYWARNALSAISAVILLYNAYDAYSDAQGY